MKKNFEIQLPIKYRPVLKKLSDDLGISMRGLLKMIIVIYIKELNDDYYEQVKKDLVK